jgi:hypothetical protein
MLRDGGPADGQPLRQFAYGQWFAPETLKQQAPGDIAEGIELPLLVSIHLR